MHISMAAESSYMKSVGGQPGRVVPVRQQWLFARPTMMPGTACPIVLTDAGTLCCVAATDRNIHKSLMCGSQGAHTDASCCSCTVCHPALTLQAHHRLCRASCHATREARTLPNQADSFRLHCVQKPLTVSVSLCHVHSGLFLRSPGPSTVKVWQPPVAADVSVPPHQGRDCGP